MSNNFHESHVYYWNQLLAIIGNYCLSQPQQEAQEPAHQRLFAIVNQHTVAASIVVRAAAVLTAAIVIQFGVVDERAIATVFSAAALLGATTLFGATTLLSTTTLLSVGSTAVFRCGSTIFRLPIIRRGRA